MKNFFTGVPCALVDTDYYGHDVRIKSNVEDSERCQEQCQSEPECFFW